MASLTFCAEIDMGARGSMNEIIISFLSGCDYKLFCIILTPCINCMRSRFRSKRTIYPNVML